MCRLIFARSKKLHLGAFMYFTKNCFYRLKFSNFFQAKFSAYSFMSKDFRVKYSISFFSIKMIILWKSNFTNAFGVQRSLVLLFEESSWNLRKFKLRKNWYAWVTYLSWIFRFEKCFVFRKPSKLHFIFYQKIKFWKFRL